MSVTLLDGVDIEDGNDEDHDDGDDNSEQS